MSCGEEGSTKLEGDGGGPGSAGQAPFLSFNFFFFTPFLLLVQVQALVKLLWQAAVGFTLSLNLKSRELL